MKNKNKAFTLTELLVALGVITVICGLLMPVITHIRPNKNVMMAKKAYISTATIVSELLKDEACYPDKTEMDGADKRIGFDDGFGYPNCKWGGSEATESITTESNPADKFKTLFFDRLGYSAPSSAGHPQNPSGSVGPSDYGLRWSYSATSRFVANDEDSFFDIIVDTNGHEGPSCTDVEYTYSGTYKLGLCASWVNPDQFVIRVYADGRLETIGEWAKDVVKHTKDITEMK